MIRLHGNSRNLSRLLPPPPRRRDKELTSALSAARAAAAAAAEGLRARAAALEDCLAAACLAGRGLAQAEAAASVAAAAAVGRAEVAEVGVWELLCDIQESPPPNPNPHPHITALVISKSSAGPPHQSVDLHILKLYTLPA